MKNEIDSIAPDGHIDGASVSALSNEQMGDSMHTTPSKEERANYGTDDYIMMNVTVSKMKDLIAAEADHIFEDCYKAKVQHKGRKRSLTSSNSAAMVHRPKAGQNPADSERRE